LPLLLVVTAFAARAEPDCEEAFHVCKDDCVVEFGGSTQVKAKKSLAKCMEQCHEKDTLCTELVMETKSNNLEDGSLDHSPSSRDVDEHGLPTRTSGSARDAVKPDEAQKAAPPEKAAKAEKPERVEKPSPHDEKPAPKEPSAPPEKAEPQVIRLEPKREKEDDLRDDKPRPEQKPGKVEARPAAPPKAPAEKPRPKKDDDDDLRNY
jgi:hypothetical protein